MTDSKGKCLIIAVSLFSVFMRLICGELGHSRCPSSDILKSDWRTSNDASIQISTLLSPYLPLKAVNVTMTFNRPYQSVVLQAIRTESSAAAAGRWRDESDQSAEVISCTYYRDTLVQKNTQLVSNTAVWIPEGSPQAVIFRAWLFDKEDIQQWSTTSSDVMQITSDAASLKRQKSRRHHVIRRDAENEVTTESGSDGETSSSQTGSIRGSDKAQSLFVLFTIIGAYIGMYTIFSLLLI